MDDVELDEVGEAMERLFETIADDKSRYLDMMFAAYLRTFGASFGSDPEDFLLSLALCCATLPDGTRAYYWASKRDLFGDDEGDDGEDTGGCFPSGDGGECDTTLGKRIA